MQPYWQMRWVLGRPFRYLQCVFSFSVIIGLTFLLLQCKIDLVWQAITYLTLLKYLHNDPGPHLIVCPASLLENWERELKKWCPSFSVLQYHGATRSAYSKELGSLAKAGLPPPFNVLLVCYSLFERHRCVLFWNRSLSVYFYFPPKYVYM
jgi:SNF2 family DNA or RNA helicase